MLILKEDTATSVKIGPFLDDTDGKTAETALTLSQADIRLSKNGGDFAPKNDANAATHDENGYYDCALNDTDTNTAGTLVLAVAESGALPVWHEFMILPANVFDSLISGLDYLDVEVATLKAAAIDSIVDDVLEGTLTLRQALRLLLAFAAGKASGGGTISVKFRDQADGKDRITMTVDSSGNRSAVTVDGS